MKEQAKHLGAWKLMPPAPGVCQSCATDHDPLMPHNAQSMFYQYKFFNDIGRWPTWTDAMAHCTPAVQNKWTVALKKHGVEVN